MTEAQRPVHVLAAGFEPFDGRKLNWSWQSLQPLLQQPADRIHLTAIELPVARRDAADRLLTALANASADVVVMFGEATGRDRVTPERIAINVDDFRIPDNLGAQPRNQRIVPAGPAGYFSTLPLTDMLRALDAAAIPAELSNTAGTYLCNHVFYRVMHALAINDHDIPAGFVHLPCLSPSRSAPATDASLFNPDLLTCAVKLCLQVAADAVRPRPETRHDRAVAASSFGDENGPR